MTASEDTGKLTPQKPGKHTVEKPLVKFAFGAADGWHERLNLEEREQLQKELNAVFEGIDPLPWGYESLERRRPLVKKWIERVNKALRKKGWELSVDLSATASTERCWYVGGEWHSCVHAPVHLREGGLFGPWTIRLDTRKLVPISLRVSRLTWVGSKPTCEQWRQGLFHVAQRAQTEKEAIKDIKAWLRNRAKVPSP